MTTVSFDHGTFDHFKILLHLTTVTFDRKWHLTTSDIWLRDVWPQVTFDLGIFDRQPRIKSHEFLSNHALMDKLVFFSSCKACMKEWILFSLNQSCIVWCGNFTNFYWCMLRMTAFDKMVTFKAIDRWPFDNNWHLTVGHLTRDIWQQLTFDRGTIDCGMFDCKWH
jgi:hypothetical protein